MLILSLTWLVNALLVLLTVAFFTLFERKVIGLVHLRLGPNKVSFAGVLQPLLDAFKLLSKQQLTSLRANKLTYTISPQLSLFTSLAFWFLLPSFRFIFANTYSILRFILLGSILVFSNLLAGWAANSKYSYIGRLRSVAQSVSYEAVLTTLIILLVLLTSTYSISSFRNTSSILLLLLLPFWLFSSLAETHRAPFDFSERESELVSGYNTEYSGGYFAFVFLSEYSALLFSCSLIYFVFFGGSSSPVLFAGVVLILSFVFIMIRVSFCRFRYDFLMFLAWKSLLPSVLFLLRLGYLVA